MQKEIESLYPQAVFVPADGKDMFKELKDGELVIGNKMYQEIHELKIFDKLQTKYSTSFLVVKRD